MPKATGIESPGSLVLTCFAIPSATDRGVKGFLAFLPRVTTSTLGAIAAIPLHPVRALGAVIITYTTTSSATSTAHCGRRGSRRHGFL